MKATITINSKKYAVDFEAVCAFIGYMNQINADKSSDAVIEAHLNTIRNFYKSSGMYEDNINFDKDLMPALEQFSKNYNYIPYSLELL